jgi:hypothetical protein
MQHVKIVQVSITGLFNWSYNLGAITAWAMPANLDKWRITYWMAGVDSGEKIFSFSRYDTVFPNGHTYHLASYIIDDSFPGYILMRFSFLFKGQCI